MLTTMDADELRALRQRGEFFWLDLNDPDPRTIKGLGEALELHPLAVEDTQEFGQRPKADVYGDQLLLVYFGAAEAGDCRPVPVEVHLHISDAFVVSVHRERCRQFDLMQERLRHHAPENGQVLVYRVIDALTDSILDVLERVAARVEEHESQAFKRPRARDRDAMAVLRRSLGAFRRVLVIQRQVFDRLVERLGQLPGLDPHFSPYYRDVGDHLWRAVDETEAARENLQGTLDTYTNEVQERLTIVATIFLPLTVVTGFFGMNFNWMINDIGSPWAFWGLGVGGVILAGVTIVLWLIRSGLYHGPGGEG